MLGVNFIIKGCTFQYHHHQDNLSHYEGHNMISLCTKSILILILVWRRHEGHNVASQTLDCWRGLPDVDQTKVRSLSILVTNSLTNSLTD